MLTFIESLFKKHTQLKAALASVAVTLAAKLGFHLTTTELLSVVTGGIALFHALAAVGASAAKREAAENAARRASR